MEKALELFAKQGFEATTVQQITEYCGISKGAFYLSFKSKGELILALIDHFMEQIISDIDHIVRTANNETLLQEFYCLIFNSFQKHSDFGKVLIKEQTQSINQEFMLKMTYYDRLMEANIQSMLERLYGDLVTHTKYDLTYCIKGFMNTYSQLFLFYNVPLDLNQLVQSLVEKTNLLAKQSVISFLTPDLISIIKPTQNEKTTKDQLINLINQKIPEIENDPIITESLELLKQNLINPTLSPAIIKGLHANIQNHPHTKWIAYLLTQS